jgi:pimeloyl-ACP methyl ester carboxylesterase
MGMPETRYARSGDVMIAYQVLGEGPFDVVFTPGTVSHVELYWEAAGVAALLRGVAEHARVMVFDKRGTGLSDRVAGAPTLEERSDDIRAVMDAAGSQRAALFGASEGVPMSVVFAAAHPERVSALVLYGGMSACYGHRTTDSATPNGNTAS